MDEHGKEKLISALDAYSQSYELTLAALIIFSFSIIAMALATLAIAVGFKRTALVLLGVGAIPAFALPGAIFTILSPVILLTAIAGLATPPILRMVRS